MDQRGESHETAISLRVRLEFLPYWSLGTVKALRREVRPQTIVGGFGETMCSFRIVLFLIVGLAAVVVPRINCYLVEDACVVLVDRANMK